MLAEKTKSKLLIGLIVLVVALTVVLIALHALRGRDKRAALPPVTPRPSAEVVIREKKVEKIITVEKEITADTVQESLRDAERRWSSSAFPGSRRSRSSWPAPFHPWCRRRFPERY